MKVQILTEYHLKKVIDTFSPLGLFYAYIDWSWIWVDNSTADSWTEEFQSKQECLDWLLEEHPIYKTIMTDYEQEAQDFLDATNTTITKKFLMYGLHFPEDTDERNIWEITLTRWQQSYTYKFWDSINNSQIKDKAAFNNLSISRRKYVSSYMWNYKYPRKENPKKIPPTNCSVISCFYICDESFADFCDSMWYDRDSIKALDIYNNVMKEVRELKSLFSPSELEKLQEIQ